MDIVWIEMSSRNERFGRNCNCCSTGYCSQESKITLLSEGKYLQSYCNKNHCLRGPVSSDHKNGRINTGGNCTHVEDCVTVIIKTRQREKHMINLLSSVINFHPDINIVISDEIIEKSEIRYNREAEKTNWYAFLNFSKKIKYIQTKPGVGLGRNIGLHLAQTKYVLSLDDDFIFTKETNIRKLVDVLEFTNISIVGGKLIPDNYFNGMFEFIQVFLPKASWDIQTYLLNKPHFFNILL